LEFCKNIKFSSYHAKGPQLGQSESGWQHTPTTLVHVSILDLALEAGDERKINKTIFPSSLLLLSCVMILDDQLHLKQPIRWPSCELCNLEIVFQAK